MPTVLPIHDAGVVDFTESVERIYASLSSMVVLGSLEFPIPSAASCELSGERADSVLAGHESRGFLAPPAFASLDAGGVPDNSSYGVLDEGIVSDDPASGALDLSGEGLDTARSSLEVGASPALSGMYEYGSLASLGSKFEAQAGAIGTADVAGETVDPSRSGIGVKGDRETPSSAALEIANDSSGLPALASLDSVVPTESGAAALGSADVQTGESVEFLVDIQDSILNSGHGDC